MKLLLEPACEAIDWFPGSSMIEVLNTQSGLRVVVASTEELGFFTEFRFGNAHAFQVLHQRDMLSYWDKPIPPDRMLFRVMGGGWLERAAPHYLQEAALLNSCEWLIVADTGPCVTVIADKEPSVLTYFA
jgi:hypothetical protein